ncbi:MAG: coenzyme F420-0:L-glutamate ligase [Patescibacteria group bacterium]
MKITPIHTNIIDPQHAPNINSILDQYLPPIKQPTIIAVTSKLVAICEKRIIDPQAIDKETLIKQEADYYLPSSHSRYNIMLTIHHHTLIPAAGIDESNANGYLIPWPADPQQSANQIREYLHQKYPDNSIGIIITDSTVTPLHWGTTGIAIAHSGFLALKNYIGQPDIFNQQMKVTMANHANALAAAATLVMGEGAEQTPIAIIEDTPFIQFQDRNPSPDELKKMVIDPADDLYAPLLQAVPWQRKIK